MHWKQISKTMSREPAVFVVGIGRSGTSALRTSLHRLPAFRAREVRSPETRVFNQPQLIRRVLDREARGLFAYMLLDEAEARRLIDASAELERGLSKWRPRLASWTKDPAARWKLLGHNHRVRLYFHHAQRARGAARILEKTPSHVAHLEEIFATFPQARAILCVRHPVDVFSSLRKRLARDREAGRRAEKLAWMAVDEDTFAGRFREVANAARAQAQRRPQQCRVLRYEDLTANPAAALSGLCEYFDETYDEEALLESREVERDAHGSPVKGSRISANEKRWDEFVDEKEAARIEDLLGPELKLFDYARYT